MSKQDRQGVRTASDLERKYNFGQLIAARNLSMKEQTTLNQLVQTLDQYMASNNTVIEELRKSIDANTAAISRLTARVVKLEGGINSEYTAILGNGKLGYMIIGKGA